MKPAGKGMYLNEILMEFPGFFMVWKDYVWYNKRSKAAFIAEEAL